MHDMVVKEVSSRLKKQLSIGNEVVVMSRDAKAISLSREYFHHVRPEATSRQTGFADGGECTIFESSSACLSFVRVFGHIERSGNTHKSIMREYYVLVEADDKLMFKTLCFKVKGPVPAKLQLDSMDNRIKEGIERAKPHRIVSILRRISELELALEMLSSLGPGDMLVLDGTLETKYEQEKKVMERVSEKARKNEILVCGISKNSGLLTSLGKPVDRLLLREGPDTPWFYYPVAEPGYAGIYFCKLHARSTYVLRTDMLDDGGLLDQSKVFAVLAFQSKDVLIPGYPYGLIKADKFARVTDSELNYLRQRFLGLKDFFGSDLHSALDNIY